MGRGSIPVMACTPRVTLASVTLTRFQRMWLNPSVEGSESSPTMRLWRPLLWLLPMATLVPLGFFAYQLATTDFTAYFGNVKLVTLVLLLGIPNIVVLAASVVGAVQAFKNRALVALVIVAVVCAWQLSPIVWVPGFWREHERAANLALFAVPGAVAGLLAVSGLFLLRHRNRTTALLVAVLLLVPVLSSVAGVVAYGASVVRQCPSGPELDLTFSGLEQEHFTSSCGIPSGVATLAGCTLYKASMEMFDAQSWDISFNYHEGPVTSDAFPYFAPYLIVGATTAYGGALGWRGEYAFDTGRHCSGTVDAYLFATIGGGDGRHVHVQGRFAAPS